MFLDKLDYLMNKKGINKNTLAHQSGIPYTTIDGFYKKGYDNIKLSTLIKLCKYFNVSLDYLVKDDEINFKNIFDELTPHENKVITAYRNNTDMQSAVDRLLGIDAEPKGKSIGDDMAETLEKNAIYLKKNIK